MSGSFDLALVFIGFFLSLCVFSLIFGDNWLFRFASSILSGVLSAFFCIFLVEKLFYPDIVQGLISVENSLGNKIVLGLVILAAFLLFIKLYAGNSQGGNLVLLILLCTAASVMVIGAVNGTLLGFFGGLSARFDLSKLSDADKADVWYWAKSVAIMIAALCSLLYTQHYTYKIAGKKDAAAKKSGIFQVLGEIVIGISLGAILAGCFIASAKVLTSHLFDMTEAFKLLLK